MTRAPLDQAEYARLLGVFEPWAAQHWNAKRAGSLRRSLEACRRYTRAVSAGYAVWWEHTPQGRDWWIQITMDNRTPDKLHATLGGTVWADGVPARYRDPYGPDTHWGRKAEQYSWGGSSADETDVPPGQRTQQFVGIGEFYKVHLTREGEFFDVRPEVSVGHPSAAPTRGGPARSAGGLTAARISRIEVGAGAAHDRPSSFGQVRLSGPGHAGRGPVLAVLVLEVEAPGLVPRPSRRAAGSGVGQPGLGRRGLPGASAAGTRCTPLTPT